MYLFLFQTMTVLNPLKQADHIIMQDTDLAGPLVFCLAFGGSLMLVSNCTLLLQTPFDASATDNFSKHSRKRIDCFCVLRHFNNFSVISRCFLGISYQYFWTRGKSFRRAIEISKYPESCFWSNSPETSQSVVMLTLQH